MPEIEYEVRTNEPVSFDIYSSSFRSGDKAGEIIIMDEATSSVDTQTEKKIQDALANLVRGRTTIAIAHRLSTLRNCNRILVIEDGTVAEVGTHGELMAGKGIFHDLVMTQKELSKINEVDG